jgi:hypothetical protein
MPLPAVPDYVVQRLGLNSTWARARRRHRVSFNYPYARLCGQFRRPTGRQTLYAARTVGILSCKPSLSNIGMASAANAGQLYCLDLGSPAPRSWREPRARRHAELGIGTMGSARSGRVLALVGMCLYGAFAVGNPVGLRMLRHVGFSRLMGICIACR